MKKIIVAIALISLISTNVGYVFAQEATQPMKNNGWNHGNKYGMQHGNKLGLKKQLNLTEEQSVKAKQFREQSREKIKPIFDQIKAERAKLREMIQQNASKDELAKQREKIAGLMNQAKEIHKQNLSNFENILTSEQKIKFAEIKKNRAEKFKENKGKKFNRKQNSGN
jgi:Spy/CpxP family protein refolding chaperone